MKKYLIASIVAITSIISLSEHANATHYSTNNILSKLKSTSGAFRFIVTGDNRSGDLVYQQIISLAMKQHPLFMINTGDIIPNAGNKKEWKNFWKISKGVTVPYFLTPGNHDIKNVKSERIWKNEVSLPGNELYYSFNVGKNLFVILDSCQPSYSKRIDGKQFQWLKRTLKPKKYTHQFIFIHHPLFMWKGAVHYGNSLDKYPKFRNRLHRLFVKKSVTAVFCAHEHTFKRLGKIDGIEYIVAGGAGAPLYSGYNNFVLVNVDGDVVQAKVIDRKNVVRKQFFIVSPRSKATKNLKIGR